MTWWAWILIGVALGACIFHRRLRHWCFIGIIKGIHKLLSALDKSDGKESDFEDDE